MTPIFCGACANATGTTRSEQTSAVFFNTNLPGYGCFLTAGGVNVAGLGAGGAAGLGAEVVAGLGPAVPGMVLSYISMMSLVMFTDADAYITGVCGLLTSRITAKPLA